MAGDQGEDTARRDDGGTDRGIDTCGTMLQPVQGRHVD
jgi:hypothetical protein